MPCAVAQRLGEGLGGLQRAGRGGRAEAGDAHRRQRVGQPRLERASGPITTRSARSPAPGPPAPSASVGLDRPHARPALHAGIARRARRGGSASGDGAIFQARACSRPPDPTRRMFKSAGLRARSGSSPRLLPRLDASAYLLAMSLADAPAVADNAPRLQRLRAGLRAEAHAGGRLRLRAPARRGVQGHPPRLRPRLPDAEGRRAPASTGWSGRARCAASACQPEHGHGGRSSPAASPPIPPRPSTRSSSRPWSRRASAPCSPSSSG